MVSKIIQTVSTLSRRVLSLTDWIGRQLHISSEWASRGGFLVLLGFGMTLIQVDEYAIALFLFMLSAVVLLSKAVHWGGFRGRSTLTSGIRVLYLLGAVAILPVSVVWTQAKRADKSWSNLKKKRPQAPAAPQLLSVVPETRDHFTYLEKHISASQARSPCLETKGRKVYLFDNLDTMPSGPGLKRPWLVATLERFVIRGPSPDIYDYFIEVSVTSRGKPSIAKGWRLCLVYEGQPFRYESQEITPFDVSTFQNKTFLEESAVHAPIKRGEAVVGWLRFRIPQNRITEKPLVGSLEYRDSLEHRYFAGFGTSEKPKPGLKVEVK